MAEGSVKKEVGAMEAAQPHVVTVANVGSAVMVVLNFWKGDAR
jgi:hypothetical protein